MKEAQELDQCPAAEKLRWLVVVEKWKKYYREAKRKEEEMKSLRLTIKELIQSPDKGLYVYFDPKLKGVVIECRSYEGGALLSNPQLIPYGELQMTTNDAVDLTGVDVIKKAREAMNPGKN